MRSGIGRSFMKNNLIDSNQGGLSIKADSRGSATSLKAYIHNNLFVNNSNLPTLEVEGRQSSPYQEVVIYRNYFTRNTARYANNIILKQVVSNFSHNYVKRNIGLQNLEVSGFDNVRLPIYQTTAHNGFYNNYAVHLESRSTIVAGTAGQHYVHNIFFNPDNDYEMITVNRSLSLGYIRTEIDARENFWGVNTTVAVGGRIKDHYDDPRLLEVNFSPFLMNNKTLLYGKCPPGWALVGDTCYIYIGAPLTYNEAKEFCQADNASMPYIIGTLNYGSLYNFIKQQQQWFLYSEKVWVQHIDRINSCTAFGYETIEIDDCAQRYGFICEIDPKVFIDPLVWRGDMVTISLLVSCILALLLIILVVVCWHSKSKYRKAQRLERRNSIRQSLHSLRSVGSTHAFSDLSYRRKQGQLSTRSTDTLTKGSNYKKMTNNGSIDSMEKSTYTSSIEDNRSYDVYETQNPNMNTTFSYSTIEHHKPRNEETYTKPSFNLAYKNEGFKDNSSFATNSGTNSIHDSTVYANDPLSYHLNDYCTTDTLPLSRDRESNLVVNSGSRNHNFLLELKKNLPNNQFENPSCSNTVDDSDEEERPKSVGNLQDVLNDPTDYLSTRARSKSEALLETSFDGDNEANDIRFGYTINSGNRSKSQPLETAM